MVSLSWIGVVSELRWPPTTIPAPFTKTSVNSKSPLYKYILIGESLHEVQRWDKDVLLEEQDIPLFPHLTFFKKYIIIKVDKYDKYIKITYIFKFVKSGIKQTPGARLYWSKQLETEAKTSARAAARRSNLSNIQSTTRYKPMRAVV